MKYISPDKKVSSRYSKFKLLDSIYTNKKLYYQGNPKLRDEEYDALESSFKAIHGEKALLEWSCVDYDESKHKLIKKELLLADILLLKDLRDKGLTTPELKGKIEEYKGVLHES